MHHYTGSAQVHQLHYLEQGHDISIVITGANAIFTLEFQHGPGGTWHPHPSFTAVAAALVNILELRCISGAMRISFAAPPSAYNCSVVAAAGPSF